MSRAARAARKSGIIPVLLMVTMQSIAAPLPYDEKAQARNDINQALAQSRASGKNALVVFGANWCPDCLNLDPKIHDRSGTLGDGRYVIVKVDVGRFNRNIDLARDYGNPISKGIPGAAIVSPQGDTLYAGPLINLIDPYRRIKRRLRQAMLPMGIALAALGVFAVLRHRRLSSRQERSGEAAQGR